MTTKNLRPNIMSALSGEFDRIFDTFADELARVKGFSIRSVFSVVRIILENVPGMVPSWLLATPEERREAVVTRVNEHIDIPVIGESTEAKLIGFVYDIVLPLIGLA